MSEWLDIDQMVQLLSKLAKTHGFKMSKLEATAVCLHMIKNGDVTLFNSNGQRVDVPELANAEFLDDIVAEITSRLSHLTR